KGEDLPPGVGLKPQVIAPGQKQAVVVVHAEPNAARWAGAIKIVGSATSKGQKLAREVRSATITWPVAQANIPTLTRLDRELCLAVRDKAVYTLVADKDKIVVNQGEKITIPVKLIGNDNFKGNVQIAAIGGPPGLIGQPVNLTP